MRTCSSITLLSLIFFVQIGSILSQEYPESINVTDFPSQNQTIYGGWIEVNSTTGSMLYYNLFSKNGTDIASTNDTNIPIIIYLEGGPSDTSTATTFAEVGPYLGLFNITTNTPYMEINPNAWTQTYNLLSIDQPVGTGFSISLGNDYVKTTEQGVDYLINFLLRFFELYPSTVNLPFYIYGRSYGAKFTSVLAYKWLQTDRLQSIDLAGIILACGLIEPVKQYLHADAYYAFGVLSKHQRDELKKLEAKMTELVQNGNLSAVTLASNPAYLQNITGGVFFYNIEKYVSKDFLYIIPDDYSPIADVQSFLMNSTSPYRISFQIPASFNFSEPKPEVVAPMVESGDFGNSTAYAVEYLLNEGVNTLIIAGQLDAALPSMGIVNYVNDLQWDGTDKFKVSDRKYLSDNDNKTVIVSYQKSDNLNLAIINKAGHYITFDQPQSVVALLDDFISNNL